MSAASWINVYKFSTGRRGYAIDQVREAAIEIGDERIARRAEAFMEHERGTLEKERLWKIAKSQKDAGRGRAVEIDNQLDRILSGMYGSVRSLKGALGEDSELGERCGAFLATYFPEGPAGITNLEFEEQLGAMKEILGHIQAIDREHARDMHVTPFSDQLASLVPEFEAELAQPTETFRFDILRAARERGHENLCLLIATIHAEHPGREPESAQKRDRLLAPIVEQNERVRARMSRRPAPDVAVDPETGRELVEPEDVLDPPADDPAEPSQPTG